MDSFSQAPDYASALERTFQSYNASLDRKEAMERQNDQRRIQNAGTPLEVIKGLVDFSVTAKNFVEERENKKWTDKIAEGPSKESLEKIDEAYDEAYEQETDEALKEGTEIYKIEQKIEREALKNGDTDIAQIQKLGPGHAALEKRDLAVALVNLIPVLFTKSGFDIKYRAAETLAEKAKVFEDFNKIVKGVGYDHIPKRLYNKFVEKEVNKFRTTLFNQGNKQIQAKINEDRFLGFAKRLNTISQGNQENFLADIGQFIEENRGAFPDDLKGANWFVVQHFLKGNEDGDIPPEQTEMLMTRLTKSKATGKFEPIEQLMNKEIVDDVYQKIENFKKQRIEKNEQSIEIKRKEAGQLFKKEQQELLDTEQRRFTEDEIKEKIKQWRATSVHPIPEAYKTALSAEDLVEESVVFELEKKFKDKIPIYNEDLVGLEDPNTILYWRQKVQSSESWAIPKNLQTEATESIKATVDAYLEVEDGSKVKSPKWVAVKQTAERRYKELYAEHIPNNTPDQAHLKALETIEKEMIIDKKYDKRPSSNPKNEYALNLEMAHSSIAANKNIITTAVIPGTNKALEQAIANPTVVPKLYEDIASKYKTMSPSDLMYAQLEAAGNKVKKDPVTEQVEKLDPDVKQLLNHHPTHGRVARALLKEYQKDGEITYDDVEFLLEEVKADQLKQIDQKLKDKGYVTPQLGALTPQQGDWQTLENGTYIVWDGDMWKQVGFLTTNREPYIGNIDEYLDKDLIRRKF